MEERAKSVTMAVFENERGRFVINGVGYTDLEERERPEAKTLVEGMAKILSLMLQSDFKDEWHTAPLRNDGTVYLEDCAKYQVEINGREFDVGFLSGPWYEKIPQQMRKPPEEHPDNCDCYWCQNPGVNEYDPDADCGCGTKH